MIVIRAGGSIKSFLAVIYSTALCAMLRSHGVEMLRERRGTTWLRQARVCINVDNFVLPETGSLYWL
jgi:hypothetical protein